MVSLPNEFKEAFSEIEFTDKSYNIVSYKAPQLPQQFKHLVLANFLNSLKVGNDFFKRIDQDAYYSWYGRNVEYLMKRPNVIIRLALLSDRDTSVGWCMSEGNILHYVWIPKDQRRKGIATDLVPKQFDTITHLTNKGINIWDKKFPLVRFNPFV